MSKFPDRPLFTSGIPEKKIPSSVYRSLRSFANGRIAMQATEGWSRRYGKTGICLVDSVYRILEALSAVVSAYADEKPLLLIGFCHKREFSRLSETAEGITGEVLKISSDIEDLENLRLHPKQKLPVLLLVSQTLLETKSGVFWQYFKIFIEKNILFREEEDIQKRYALRRSSGPVQSQRIIRDLASRLSASKRPLVYVGKKALLYCPVESLLSIIGSLHAPVLLSVDAAGVSKNILGRFRDNIPKDRILEPASLPAMWTLLRSDLVLALDVELGESEGFGLHDLRWKLKSLCQIRSERASHLMSLAHEELHIHGEITTILLQMMRVFQDGHEQSHGMLSWRNAKRRRWLFRVSRVKRRYLRAISKSANKEIKRFSLSKRKPRPLLDPAFLADSAMQAASKESIFFSEGNAAGMWFWSHQERRPMLYPNRMASIGVALGWMLGAGAKEFSSPIQKDLPYWKKTEGGASFWTFLGDGSLCYQSSLLADLKEAGIGGNIIVFNNSAWSAIRIEQKYVFFGRYPGTNRKRRDLSEVARYYGIEAIRIESRKELQEALRYATGQKHALLVLDVALPEDALPYAGMTFALAELDYILGVKSCSVAGSVLWAMIRGRFPWRAVGILRQMLLGF